MNEINWVALNAIADTLAAVGLIISLIYVAVQVRQNSEAIRLNTETAKVAAYHQAIEQIAASWMQPEFAILSDKYATAPDSLSSQESSRLKVLWSATLFGHEIAFELCKKQRIDPVLWANMLENNYALLTQSLPMQLLGDRPGPLSRALFSELSEMRRQNSSTDTVREPTPNNTIEPTR
jgi:hypothetical protein